MGKVVVKKCLSIFQFSTILGTFASVKLCKHRGRSSYFALKVMAIEEILKLKQAEHVKNEKKILEVKNN